MGQSVADLRAPPGASFDYPYEPTLDGAGIQQQQQAAVSAASAPIVGSLVSAPCGVQWHMQREWVRLAMRRLQSRFIQLKGMPGAGIIRARMLPL